jgi:TatA/E family protein of Tat protein translocase
MGGFSLMHWLIVAVVVLLFFGKGRFSATMTDLAKGFKSFKNELVEDNGAPASAPGNRTDDQSVALLPVAAGERAPEHDLARAK